MKSATGFTGSGSRDWIAQRLSALILGVYVVVVLGWMVAHPHFDYTQWSNFMLSTPMKIFSTVAILGFIAHAWVGVWTVITDYVKPSGTRMVLELLAILAVLVYTVWALMIFWG